jgi:hypothetical protein
VKQSFDVLPMLNGTLSGSLWLMAQITLSRLVIALLSHHSRLHLTPAC